MKKRFILAAALSCQQALAQVAPYAFHLGALRVTADADTMVVHTRPPLEIRILPGGHTWPLLALDEAGTLYAGDRIIDARRSAPARPAGEVGAENVVTLPHGYRVTALKNAYRIAKGAATCTFTPRQLGLRSDRAPLEALTTANIVFRATDRKLLALSTWPGWEKSETRYSVNDIDLSHCRVRGTRLGNPDLLVELNASSGGGWWITGSIEQTLLQSNDGRHWRKLALPGSLSSLVSAYIVSPNDMWLAGMLPDGQDDDPALIHTTDGGKHWNNVARTDPALKQLPVGWLEGWQRLGRPIEP